MKKKGFTLIELLAVIVILAIIALIAVPIVLNIIGKAKEGSAKSSGIAYVKAVETYIATSLMDKTVKEEDKLKPGKDYKTNNITKYLELKGDKPSGGEVTIGSKNEVSKARMIINGYIVRYDGKDYKVVGKAENLPATYTSIAFEPSSVEVKERETLKLNPTLAPDDVLDGTILWTSSDESIATVDNNGTVTGVKKGTATITAKMKKNNEVTASVTVNVIKNCPGSSVPYESGINLTANTLKYEGKTFVGTGIDNLFITPLIVDKKPSDQITAIATSYCTGCRLFTVSEASRMTDNQRRATYNGNPQLWSLSNGYVCQDGVINCNSDSTGSDGGGIRPAIEVTDSCVLSEGNNTYSIVK